MRMQQDQKCGSGSASGESTWTPNGEEPPPLAVLTFQKGRIPASNATIWLRPDGSAYQVFEAEERESGLAIEYLGEHDQRLKGEALGTVLYQAKGEASILME